MHIRRVRRSSPFPLASAVQETRFLSADGAGSEAPVPVGARMIRFTVG